MTINKIKQSNWGRFHSVNKIALTSILFLYTFGLFSQQVNFQWAKNFGGLYGAGHSLCNDLSGNVYCVGIFSGTGDFDPGPGTYTLSGQVSDDIFISKLDNNGNLIWVKQISGQAGEYAYDVCVDQNDDVIMAGSFYATTDFDPGPTVFSLTSHSITSSAFVVKLNSNGAFIWAKAFEGANARSITTDNFGNIYVVGGFFYSGDLDPGPATLSVSSNGGEDIFIAKLDAQGNLIWVKTIGGTSDERANSVCLDKVGNVCLTGHFNSTVDFDPGITTDNLVATGQDVFVLKLDGSGNYVWSKKIGGSGNDFATGIESDELNNLLLTGVCSINTDFDPGPGTFTLTIPFNIGFVEKLSSTGSFIWAKNLGSFVSQGLYYWSDIFVSGKAIFVSGSFVSTNDFDPGPTTYTIASAGSYDAFVTKLNDSGDLQWAKSIGGKSQDYANSVFVDGTNIYTTGYFKDTCDFDPSNSTYTLSSISGPIYIQKMNDPDVGIPTYETQNNLIRVSPNPFSKSTKLETRIQSANLEIEIYNYSGKLIDVKYVLSDTNGIIPIVRDDLISGIYTLVVKKEGLMVSRTRVVVLN